MPAKGVPRRWHLDNQGIRREGSKESGFAFRTATGAEVHDEKTLARVLKLRLIDVLRVACNIRNDQKALLCHVAIYIIG